jgi:hypothetical protein
MYKVYDNILPKKVTDEICDYVCRPGFIWYAGPGGRTLNDQSAEKYLNFQNSVQLTHPFLTRSQQWINGGIKEEYIRDYNLAIFERNMLINIIIKFLGIIGEDISSKIIHRAKANLLLESLDTTPNPPHIDVIDMKHQVFLMYMNDCDGDTLIYEDKSANKILTRITPKKGRILFFDGHHYHSSTPPTNNPKRMVINVNLINEQDLKE